MNLHILSPADLAKYLQPETEREGLLLAALKSALSADPVLVAELREEIAQGARDLESLDDECNRLREIITELEAELDEPEEIPA